MKKRAFKLYRAGDSFPIVKLPGSPIFFGLVGEIYHRRTDSSYPINYEIEPVCYIKDNIPTQDYIRPSVFF